MQSANKDYSHQTLYDIIYSFYSYDDIKLSKEIIYNILGKSVTTRKNPDRKKKELDDLMQCFNEFNADTSRETKIKFVSDNYKKMSPLGLEFVAPLLINLTEEVSKINEILPKILDVKSEVRNTADTVRDLKMELNHTSSAIEKSLNNIENSNYGNKINSPRTVLSMNNQNSITKLKNSFEALSLGKTNNLGQEHINTASSPNLSFSEKLKPSTPKVTVDDLTNALILNDQKNLANMGSPSKKRSEEQHKIIETDKSMNIIYNKTSSPRNNEEENEDNEGEWIVYNSKKRRNSSRNKRFTGARNGPGNFRAASRTCDLFVGRVDLNVKSQDISDYVLDSFGVNVLDIEKLDIASKSYNAFKISINLSDRDTLFKPDDWPQGIIINKFYSKRSR